MKESSQLTMAGLTARVMAVSILTEKVYTRTVRGEETLKEKGRQNRFQSANRCSGGGCNECFDEARGGDLEKCGR